MNTPVGNESPTVVPPPAPAQAPLLERPPGRGPLEQLPVESLRDGHFRFGRRAVAAAGKLDHRVRDLPQLAVLHDLRGFLEVSPRALLRAELDDALGALVGVERLDGAF